MRRFLLFIFTAILCGTASYAQPSIARQWNEVQLAAIREDLARPPVQARNLFHVSIAMYDAWAAYDTIATTYLLGKTINGTLYNFQGINPVPAPQRDSFRNVAISYAAYRLLCWRYRNSPNAATSLDRFHSLMINLGYDTAYHATDYVNGTAADLGNYIASQVIQMGLSDNSREAQNYSNADYLPMNPPLYTDSSGNPHMLYPNSWQPLYIVAALDQNGQPIGSLQKFVCPEWGRVVPFELTNPTNYVRNGHTYPVYLDPGAPPMLDTVNVLDSSSYYFKWGHTMVNIWSSHLTPDDGVMMDISPNALGNVTNNLPTTLAGQHAFYNYLQGGDPGTGYTVNPVTGLPYTPQIVKRGDYTRVISQYWADGPTSETPPGHWYVLLNQVSDDPLFQKKYEGTGPVLDDLEWDVKAYFTLGGAVHDAAIAAWGIKGWYDSPRPISMIRKMARYGQSSDPGQPSYHPGGIPLVPGYIELINTGDPLAGPGNINVGKIKLKAWRGPSVITDPSTQYAGVDWILADDWMPYQRPTFVTPPFAGYISGHSTYSRAAAEVLTSITGSPFFPGGMGHYFVPANFLFLNFEQGPTTDIDLQWATYRDASNQSSLSRIWGSIHPPFDDIPGRIIGQQIGIASHNKAKTYFSGTILPITLSSFTAAENNCRVNIRWSTATELNTASYTVLKSTDGIHFNQVVANVRAAGNSTTTQQYQVIDGQPGVDNYYQLVQYDKDGRQKSFNVVYVPASKCTDAGSIVKNLAPNPSQYQSALIIVNSGNAKLAQITIFDMQGRLQGQQANALIRGENTIVLETAELPAGTYMVKIMIDGVLKSTQKIVKLH